MTRMLLRCLVARVITLALLVPLTAYAVEQPSNGGPSLLPPRTVVVHRTAEGALDRSLDGGLSWEPVSGLPTRVLPAYRAGETLPVTAFAVALEPNDADARAASPGITRNGFRLVTSGSPAIAAVGRRVFVSTDGLTVWRESEIRGASAATYVTALAIDPQDHDHWLAGTSYAGLYRTVDAGLTWTELTRDRSRWPLYLGAGFFEEIAAIWFTASGEVLLQAGFGQGFYRVQLDPVAVQRLGPFAEGEASYGMLAQAVGVSPPPSRPVSTGDVASAARRMRAAGRTGIYLAAQHAAAGRLESYFDYLERHGFDKLVVDFKDDYGRLTYDSAIPLARAAGAVTPIIDPVALVEAAHARGIYVVARVVVFQDRRLYAVDNHRYALWDRVRDRPWGVFRTVTDAETGPRSVQVEYWVDPYSEEVWQYNVDIAREIVSFGVDEIQFDYIRFPSDGETATIKPRFEVVGADRVQALEGFLAAARAAIDVPIGIDVFGFNAWARMGYLGQDITRLARYVDVISPMFYPSHFARSFLPQFSYLDRAYLIYDLGSRRAIELGAPALIRPYIQAFLIGSELQFDVTTYRRYLDLQLEASSASGASGYTLWNASGRYYMLP